MMASIGCIANSEKEVTTTSQPGQFLKEWMQANNFPKDTLVVLDLDDTTITTPEGQWLGRSDMFYDLLDREQKKYPEKNKDQLAAMIDPLLIAIYERVPVVATDHKLPSVIRSMQERGVQVIGMTSRGHTTKEVTLYQL